MNDKGGSARTHGPTVVKLRAIAALLDSQFRIPGTRIRFGIDPLLSLIPGLGDLTSPIFTMVLLGQGIRQHVPKVVLFRMMMNAFLDALIGAVPLLGNIGDVFWRANEWNLALLERHAAPGRPPTSGDYAFLFIVAAVFGLLIAIPVFLAFWLAGLLLQLLMGH